MTVRHLLFLAALTVIPVAPSAAQELGVAAGRATMGGRIGSSRSDAGVVARAGVLFGSGRYLRFGLEGAVERLNEHHQHSSSTCFLPAGGTGGCTFDLWERDTGWSLAGVVRLQPPARVLAPYAVLGLGFLRVRAHSRQLAVDAAGNPLQNFIYDATYSDDALQLHSGAGVDFRPGRFPIRVFVEGRAIRLLHNYSGGLQGAWSSNLLLGVRWQLAPARDTR